MATYVLPGWIVSADVAWKNKGAVDYAPRFRLDLRPTVKSLLGGPTWTTWVEGPWVDSPLAKPGETVEVKPFCAIPANWGVGTKISVKIMLLGKEPEMWGASGWWKSGVGIDILEIPQPSADWVEIISVTPYAPEWGP